MTELNESTPVARRNPLIWIVLIVVGLILFVFLGGERGDVPVTLKVDETVVVENDNATVTEEAVGTIDRGLLVPPGMRAREYIARLRAAGEPYPLSQAYDKAEKYHIEGSLADAHLLYFFAARENHLPAIMMMGEMSDPGLFRAEDSLLDQADPIQAFKWYSKAAQLGQPGASQRLEELRRWAGDAASAGSPEAGQLLLNFQ